jgi:hypothetical protein
LIAAGQPLVFDMALLRSLLWFALFVMLTFCFVVLFEYGPRDFAKGAQKEYSRIKLFVLNRTEDIRRDRKAR